MPQRKFNLFFPAVMSLLALVVLISSTQAQYCPSSQLNYIVRDANGKIINPVKLDAPDFIEEDVMEVSYAEAEKKREGRWAPGDAVKAARELISTGKRAAFLCCTNRAADAILPSPSRFVLLLAKSRKRK